MKSNRWAFFGASAIAAGVFVLGMAYATSGVAHATIPQVPCDATSFTSGQVDPAPDVAAAGIVAVADSVVPCTATPTTPTPQRKLKTHTPTVTPTESPKTATPVPTNTQPVPTNTPKAASEAVSVKPPNTGSGDSLSGGNLSLWLAALGAMSVALGGGAVLVGVRRRS